MAVRPSTWRPKSIFVLPFSHQVTLRSTTFSLAIHWAATMSESRKLTPTAPTPTQSPLLGSFLPKNRMTTNDSAGMRGMSQAFSAMDFRSALHEVDLVEVDADPVPVDEQHDGEADSDFGGGDGDDEEGEDLTGDVAELGREGDEVEVHGVEHKLDAHEHEDAVAPGQDPVDADTEQEGGQEQELGDGHSFSPSGRGRWRPPGRPAAGWRPPRRGRRRCGRWSQRGCRCRWGRRR